MTHHGSGHRGRTRLMVDGAALALLVLTAPAALAADPPAAPTNACVVRVLAEDDRLGRERNRRPESVPIAQAIVEYADAVERLDYTGCPTRFVAAFRGHLTAWRATRPVLERFAALRGEMHALFERIKAHPDGALLAPLEAEIWRTWSEVEAAGRAAGG